MNKNLIILVLFFLIFIIVFQTYNYYKNTEETIVVGYLPSNHHSALFVAEAKDMFKKEGIKVHLVPFRAGHELITAAERGQIDIGYCGISPVTSAIDKGIPIKIIAAVNQEGSGVVVKKNSNFNDITNLKGKSIAIPEKGSVQDVLLADLLYKNNISSDEVHIVESEVPLMPKSLLFNKFAAFIAWEPYVSVARFEGDGDVLMYSGDIWNNHPCCVVIAREEFIQKKPDSIRKFLNVHIAATDFINSSKNETALIISKKLGTNIDVEKEGLKHVEFIAIPSNEFIRNSIRFSELQKQLGYLNGNLSGTEMFDLEYLPRTEIHIN
ncbi:MAG: ABC transporter substrate-binding protein [Methanobacterium sp.]|nr:ABC transporter substrate-binding protein [Methanobacterium sp.]